jgi:hypothetical protein
VGSGCLADPRTDFGLLLLVADSRKTSSLIMGSNKPRGLRLDRKENRWVRAARPALDAGADPHPRRTRATRSARSATSSRRRRPVARPTPRALSLRRSASRLSSPTPPSASACVCSSSRTARRSPPSCRCVSLHFASAILDLGRSSRTTVALTSSTRTTRSSSPASVVAVRPRVISPVSASRSSRSQVSVSLRCGRRRRCACCLISLSHTRTHRLPRL